MIARLARRLGFQPSVPVGVVDDWLMPRDDRATALAPRGAPATALVDRVGRVQPAGRTWTLDWSLAAGARWVSAIEAERVSQRLVGASTLETTVQTPAGEVVQRVAAAVVGGEPVIVGEIENRGGVAIAAGLVVRPLVHGARGHLARVSVGPDALDLGDQGAVRFEHAAATSVSDGVDLLGAMPDPDHGSAPAELRSRSGGAQAAAVFPVPHTATLRFVVELAGSVRRDAAVPSIDDIERGWAHHLRPAGSLDVGDTDLAARLTVAARTLLTSWPGASTLPASMTALAEIGFADEARRLFVDLDRVEDAPGLLVAIARWAQLGDRQGDLDVIDRSIGPIARAVHIAGASSGVAGPAWLPWAFGALALRLDAIEQPDVAEALRAVETTEGASGLDDADLESLLADGSTTMRVPSVAEPTAASRLVMGARGLLIADRADGADLLGGLPVAWRGRTIDAHRMPVEGGTVSFGLRWHGPRPALLWQVDRVGGPYTITAASIDPSFATTETEGEVLLADPGWPRR